MMITSNSNSQLSGWKNRFFLFSIEKTTWCAQHSRFLWKSVGKDLHAMLPTRQLGKCPFNKNTITHWKESELDKGEIALARKKKNSDNQLRHCGYAKTHHFLMALTIAISHWSPCGCAVEISSILELVN